MAKYCCVDGCLNSSTTKGVTLHALPILNKPRMEEWSAILKKDDSKDFTFSGHSRICSAHFEDSDFAMMNGVMKLKKQCLPTILPWRTILKSNTETTSPQFAVKTASSTNAVPSNFLRKQTKSKTEEPPPVVIICGNCCSLIKKDDMCVRKYTVKDNRTETKKHLYVHDVIAYLYGVSWDSFIKYLNKKKTVGDCELKSKMELQEIGVTNRIKTVALCRSCASLLYAIYLAHLNFERVSQKESIVKRVKEFRNLGRRAGDLKNFEAPERENSTTPNVGNETDYETSCNANINDFLKVEINDNNADIESSNLVEMAKEVVMTEEVDDLLFNDFNFEDRNDDTRKPPEVDMKCEEELMLPIGSSRMTVEKSTPTATATVSKYFNVSTTPKNPVLITKSVPKQINKSLVTPQIKNFKALSTNEKVSAILKSPLSREKVKTGIPVAYSKTTKDYVQDFSIPENVYRNKNIPYKAPVDVYIEKTTMTLNMKQYNCAYCLKAFMDKEAWNIHTTECEKKKPDIFTCKICDKTFKDYFQYKYFHVPTHGKEQQKKMACNICGKLLPNRKSLKRHVTKVHNKVLKYSAPLLRKCPICYKFIMGKGGKMLEAHMKIHDHIWYYCKLCPAKFKTGPERTQHRQTHKEKEPLFCKICKRIFYFKDALETHELRHVQEKKFSCDLCDKKFHLKESLRSHKIFRHNETGNTSGDFVCQECGQNCKTAGHLTSHIRKHQEDGNAKGGLECDVCGKVLKHSSSLREHKKKVHYKVVKYECSICGQKLSGPKMLKYHESLHADPNFKGRPRKPKQWRNKIRITEEDEAPSTSSESSQNEAQQMQTEKPISTGPSRNISRRRFLDDYV